MQELENQAESEFGNDISRIAIQVLNITSDRIHQKIANGDITIDLNNPGIINSQIAQNAAQKSKRILQNSQKSFDEPSPEPKQVRPKSKLERQKDLEYAMERKKKNLKFLSNLAADRKAREARKQAQIQQFRQQLEDDQVVRETEQITELEQQAKNRHEQARKSFERHESAKVARAEFIAKGNQNLKNAKSQKPLYQKLEMDYYQNSVLPELEARKKSLSQKRILAVPLNRTDIDEHEKRFIQQQRQSAQRRQRETNAKRIEMQINSHSPGTYYRSKAWLQEEDEKQSRPESNRYGSPEQERVRRMKRDQYAEIVRTLYWPQVDSDQKSQVLPNPRRYNTPSPGNRIKANFTPASKTPQQGIKSITDITPPRPVPLKRKPRPEPVKRPPPKAVEQQMPSIKPPAPDYLAQMREKRQNKITSQSNAQLRVPNWDKVIQNESIPASERLSKIQASTYLSEQRARREEAAVDSLPIGSTLDTKDRVDDVFIESIKAKLALLQALS